jgi:hypothetical protein
MHWASVGDFQQPCAFVIRQVACQMGVAFKHVHLGFGLRFGVFKMAFAVGDIDADVGQGIFLRRAYMRIVMDVQAPSAADKKP